MSAQKAKEDEAIDCGDDFEDEEVGDEGPQGNYLVIAQPSASSNVLGGLSPRISGGNGARGISQGLSAVKLAGSGGLQLGSSPVKSGGLRARRQLNLGMGQSSEERIRQIHNKAQNLQSKFEAYENQSFQSQYVVAEKLGEGMHAQVHKCYKIADIEKTEPYAVKSSREDDEEKKQAHVREYNITKNLNHKNVVTSIDFFDDEIKGEIHQVLGYIKGMEVLDHVALQPHGHYNEQTAKQLFHQVIEGVQYLHEKSVAHRDIKPQNLLVTEDHHLYILDFNVSSLKSDHSQPFKMMTKTGTVAFSAPEIFTQQVYDEKVDIWSCGIVLYMMLSGNQPFNEENVAHLVHQITTQELNFDSNCFKQTSKEAIDLMKKLLRKNPQERPSAEQILNDEWLLKKDVPFSGYQDTFETTQDVLRDRRSLRIEGRMSSTLTMKVGELMQDLLKNGLDLSFLKDVKGTKAPFGNFLNQRNTIHIRRSGEIASGPKEEEEKSERLPNGQKIKAHSQVTTTLNNYQNKNSKPANGLAHITEKDDEFDSILDDVEMNKTDMIKHFSGNTSNKK